MGHSVVLIKICMLQASCDLLSARKVVLNCRESMLRNNIIMVALWNRADHYIFALWFLLLSFFFFPRLISAVADWMSTILPHVWCGLNANLECRCETCCTRLAENTGRKKSPKIAIWAPSHNFVGLYLRN